MRAYDPLRVLLVLVTLLPAVPQAPAPSHNTPARTRVLFIGNSLTTANDLPGLVEHLSAAGGGQPIACRTVAFPGYSLEDHWNRGDAQRAIAEGGWSIVVLQQGPSALPASRVLLRDYSRRFDGEAKRVGARTALYMVWPSAVRRRDFDASRDRTKPQRGMSAASFCRSAKRGARRGSAMRRSRNAVLLQNVAIEVNAVAAAIRK